MLEFLSRNTPVIDFEPDGRAVQVGGKPLPAVVLMRIGVLRNLAEAKQQEQEFPSGVIKSKRPINED